MENKQLDGQGQDLVHANRMETGRYDGEISTEEN